MKKVSLVSILLLLVVIVGCTPAASPSPAPGQMPVRGGEENVQQMEQHSMPPDEHVMPEGEVMNHSMPSEPQQPSVPAGGNLSGANVKEFNVEAFQFGYEPSEIHVKLGDTVKIHLHTRDVGHSLNIRDYKVNVMANPGTDGERTFVADKAGSFNWRCTLPCGHGHDSMHGTLVVE